MIRRFVAGWSELVAPAVVLLVSLLGLTGALYAAGYDGAAALASLWRGSFGSVSALLSSTLVRATPLLLAGLGVGLAFRAGIWNIGAEGQILTGAAAATAVGVLGLGLSSFAHVLLVLLSSIGAGMLWAWVAETLRVRRGVLEVISTIMLNFVALYLVGYLVHGPLQEPLGIYPQSASIEPGARLPRVVPGTRLHAGFVIAIVSAPLLWWWLRSTAAGFRTRVVGANPLAAWMAGRINVRHVAGLAFVTSGGLAGLAGGVEVSGVTYALYDNMSAGTGYTAVVVALLGRLNPLGIVAAALVFGGLESGALAMQRDAGVPSVVVTAVEAALVLMLLLVERWRQTRTLPNASADSGDAAHEPDAPIGLERPHLA